MEIRAYLSVDQPEVNGLELTARRSKKTRTGDARSSPLKVVCSVCNEGWMSSLQEQNKDIIIPIGDRQKHALSVEEQMCLSKWAIMTTMVMEHFHPDLSFSTFKERKAFAETGVIPDNWFVWVAAHEGDRWIGHNHFGTHIFEGHAQKGIQPTGLGNQSTAWVVAGVFFLTARESGVPFWFQYHEGPQLPTLNTELPIPRLWPTSNISDIPCLDDEAADDVSRIPLGIRRENSRRVWETL